jgi:hypothetical protein
MTDTYGIARAIEEHVPRLLAAGPLCKDDKHDLLEAMRRVGMGREVKLVEQMDLKELHQFLYRKVLR